MSHLREPDPRPTPTLLSWSSGKDSAFALGMLRRVPSVEVRGLLTTVNRTHDRVAMHAVRRELLRAQARALGLPLIEVEIPSPCSNEQYEAALGREMGRARAEGIEAIAFGDIHLADIRAYRERVHQAQGLECLFPIWGRDTRELGRTMVDAGIVARLTCVDPSRCSQELIGRSYDARLLDELPAAVDPCGEYGEFHTFVTDGPGFRHPIEVVLGDRVMRDGFLFQDLVPAFRAARPFEGDR